MALLGLLIISTGIALDAATSILLVRQNVKTADIKGARPQHKHALPVDPGGGTSLRSPAHRRLREVLDGPVLRRSTPLPRIL